MDVEGVVSGPPYLRVGRGNSQAPLEIRERTYGNVRPGGKWRSDGVGADGRSFYVEGEYLEVDPPRLLVHTWISSYGNRLKTIVRWELEPQTANASRLSGLGKSGARTLVRVRHEGFAGDVEAATRHSEGWRQVLGRLKGFAENKLTNGYNTSNSGAGRRSDSSISPASMSRLIDP